MVKLRVPDKPEKMTALEIRDALLSLSPEERKFVISDPEPGEYSVYSIAKSNSGNPVKKIAIECDLLPKQ